MHSLKFFYSSLSYFLMFPRTWAQNLEPPLAGFGSVQRVLGNYDRTDIDFTDGLAIDILSPSNRTFAVVQNSNPLDGAFVSGANGEGWRAVQPYSYIINVDEPANDLIAKVELPYDPTMLQTMGIDQADTAVGRLAADGKSWVVSESQRNVHVTENKTRIIKMTSIAGEYRLLGRKQADKANIFVQYGQGITRTANFTGGSGRQEAEFIDGLRFSLEANLSITMNVEIKPLDQATLFPDGMRSLNSFAWVVNTSASTNVIPPAPLPPIGSVSPAPPTPAVSPALPSPLKANVLRIPDLGVLNLVVATSGLTKRQTLGLPNPEPPSPLSPIGTGDIKVADIQFPLNLAMLNSLMNIGISDPNGTSTLTPRQTMPDTGGSAGLLSQFSFAIGTRVIGATTAPFKVIQSSVSVNQGGQLQGDGISTTLLTTGDEFKVKLSGLTALDGEYVVLVSKALGAGILGQANSGLTKTSGGSGAAATAAVAGTWALGLLCFSMLL